MKKMLLVAAVLTIMVLMFAACGGDAAPAPAPTPTPEPATAAPAATEAPAPAEAPTEDPTPAATGDIEFALGVLPRNETLFFGGLQWGAPVSANPFHPNPTNAFVNAQAGVGGASILTVNETLFMFNPLTGDLVPLIASGQPRFAADLSTVEIDINPDARWSDGTPVTAQDVVTTWETHRRVGTASGLELTQFVTHFEVSGNTAIFHINPDNINPHAIRNQLTVVYVQQAAWIDATMAAVADYPAFREADWDDAPTSGPYRVAYQSNLMQVLERRDDYWGQAASMWGRLPVPRFLAHNFYADNDVKRASFAAGQIDVNQQFMSNVWDLWEGGAPVSTFLPELPFYMPGTMPSIFFNTTRPGLDNRYVRQAIAFAIDYEQIVAAAMSGYSPTFTQAPRSIAVPFTGEMDFVDMNALAPYQWGNADIDRANALLDYHGIIDNSGNGIREWPPGNDLVFQLTCPAGWTDWNASLEIVAAAGAAIGIDLSTNFTEAAVWTDNLQLGTYDIIMNSVASVGAATPWQRAFAGLHIDDTEAERFFRAWHRLYDPEINALIERAASVTDMAEQIEIYTELSRHILTEMPFVYLMYRPAMFHTVNESVWTGFPEYGDGTNIPPTVLVFSYGIAGLYNLRLR